MEVERERAKAWTHRQSLEGLFSGRDRRIRGSFILFRCGWLLRAR